MTGSFGVEFPVATRRYLMIRGVALVLLLMVGYIAWTRNFGEGVKGVPLLALLSAALSFALEWIDHSQSERAKKYLTHTMLSLPLLIVGYVVAIVLLSLNAPVIVLTSADQPLAVTLEPMDTAKPQADSATSSKEEPARFHTWSTPLGRPFRLKVRGYAAKIFDVAAPVGVNISTERDLVPQLVILIRPTLDGMIELRSGGSVHVFRKKDARESEIAHAQPNTASAVLLGAAPVTVPHDLIEDWRLELAGQNMSDTARAKVLRAWKTPTNTTLDSSVEELASHQSMRVELRNKTNEPVQCGAMELPESAGIIVDFPLEPCPPAGDATVPKQ